MPLILYVWRNRWLRYFLLLLVGGFIYLGATGMGDEAAKYADGPQSVDIETLTSESLENDYVQLTGLTDGGYMYSFSKEGNSEEIDLEESIILYYALHTPEQYDVALQGGASQPPVFVRQVLPQEQRACVNSEEKCLTPGELTLEGRLSKTIPFEADQDDFDDVFKNGGYVTDANTLYLDANWQPVTASGASTGKNVGLAWLGATVAGLFYSIFKRRKKNVADVPISQDPNLTASREQS
jgi:LPXTG-motif cell wall-anchored protein